MKHLPHVLRPFYAMNWQFYLSLFLSLWCGTTLVDYCYVQFHQTFNWWFQEHKVSPALTDLAFSTCVTFVVLILVVVLLLIVVQFRTRRYPATYLYCFHRKGIEGTAENDVCVIGHFSLKCTPKGHVVADGVSCDWDDNVRDIVPNSEVGWRSHFVALGPDVAGTVASAACYILYYVKFEHTSRRSYVNGLLRFEYIPGQEGVVAKSDTYSGDMQDIETSTHWAKVYAEKVGKGHLGNDEIHELFRKNGRLMMKRLKGIRSR